MLINQKKNRRSRLKSLMRKARVAGENAASWFAKQCAKSEAKGIVTPDERERISVIKSMSNWQHHQMMKACHGHVGSFGIEELRDYAQREHWKAGAS